MMTNNAIAKGNPFFHPSSLPYGVEPIDKIKSSDFEIAIKSGMAQESSEIDLIANNPEEPTFANTIEAMEHVGGLLSRANALFQQIVAANTNDVLDKIDERLTPLLQAHSDAIIMNQKLFARVKTLYEKREELGLDAKQKFLLEWQYRRFCHAGALLPPDQKTELLTINKKLAVLSTKYRKKLLLANNEAALLLDDRQMLDGLDETTIAMTAENARKHHHDGKYLLTIRNTTQQPLLEQLKNRDTRRRLMEASENRGKHAGKSDLRELIGEIAVLRAQKAGLMGYGNFADFVTAEQMAKTREAAVKLIQDLAPPANRKTRMEADELQSLIKRQGDNFVLTSYDWPYYAAQLRKEKYDLNDDEVRQYFEFNNVLENGVFFAATQIYGLTFKERHDIPTYHQDMRVFEIFDFDGSPLALFMIDPFARPNKNGGAWCSTLNQPNMKDQKKPVIVNVENFPKPDDGHAVLLSFDDVTTVFHEFGHALHAIFSVQYYPSESGSNMPVDVIEFPSQFNEHWAHEPDVFANYAKHYRTGEAMPQSMVEKITKARLDGTGYRTLEYVAAALLDLEWHSLPPRTSRPKDVDGFEINALEKNGVGLDIVPPRYHSTYFMHIWGDGYESNYYSYMWGEILDDDAYEWFKENGGMNRTNGQIFRDKMLGQGFTADPMDIYRNFRGRDPNINAIQRERGLD